MKKNDKPEAKAPDFVEEWQSYETARVRQLD